MNYQAIRAYNHLLNQHDGEWGLSFEMDHAVCPDGYGQEALWGAYEAHKDYLCTTVAARFNLTKCELEQQWFEYINAQPYYDCGYYTATVTMMES